MEHTRRVLEREIITLENAAAELVKMADAYYLMKNIEPPDEVAAQVKSIHATIAMLRGMVTPAVWSRSRTLSDN
ncbi:MAG TPA: hypothetical protein VF671_11260 [Pseudomonas sp.]|jgi:hypothetical protein|uniref:hypothetical protein n=1 Tax=Pseudomonas sp. TaxID=306 RepID=UPI002EDA212F